jgi:hypothetical protein
MCMHSQPYFLQDLTMTTAKSDLSQDTESLPKYIKQHRISYKSYNFKQNVI